MQFLDGPNFRALWLAATTAALPGRWLLGMGPTQGMALASAALAHKGAKKALMCRSDSDQALGIHIKGGSFRVDRHRCIEGRCPHQVMSAKPKITKMKTTLKQETYNLSDLTRKHDLRCGFVELGGSVSVSS